MPACTHAPARHPPLEQRASDIRIHAAPPSPPLMYFPAIPPVSPGGGAHCGRGMQPHISDSWPAELGAAAARHGSISWERTLACVCVCIVVVFVVFWVVVFFILPSFGTPHTRIYFSSLSLRSVPSVRERSQLRPMRHHAHHLVPQRAAVRLLPADLPHPHQRQLPVRFFLAIPRYFSVSSMCRPPYARNYAPSVRCALQRAHRKCCPYR